jgi:selenocysteine lyase/cysteine desulfurase
MPMSNFELSGTYKQLASELQRYRDKDFSKLNHDTYLDYTGAFPAPASLISHHQKLLADTVWGNPHSEHNSASKSSTDAIESARRAVLRYFNGGDEYEVAFTANASHGCHLLGEAFPFSETSGLVICADDHNSGNGIREFARARGAPVRYVRLTGELRMDEADLMEALTNTPRGLFVFPAQSNFSGVRHPLEYIQRAQDLGWKVLLDAAAYVPTGQLNLRKFYPDYVPLSFYKMFGYPTGVGALLLRKTAIYQADDSQRHNFLQKPWFAGGTIFAVSALGGWHINLRGYELFEEGTPNFLSIPAVTAGLEYLQKVGVEYIGAWTKELAGLLLRELQTLKHDNGRELVRLYGPHDTASRGAAVSCNLLSPDGAVVDERVVGLRAQAWRICLRTGCFCNPGAGEAAFGISPEQLRQAAPSSPNIVDSYEERLHRIGLPTGGAIRVSLGFPTTLDDIERFIDFARSFLNQNTFEEEARLEPRGHC